MMPGTFFDSDTGFAHCCKKGPQARINMPAIASSMEQSSVKVMCVASLLGNSAASPFVDSSHAGLGLTRGV